MKHKSSNSFLLFTFLLFAGLLATIIIITLTEYSNIPYNTFLKISQALITISIFGYIPIIVQKSFFKQTSTKNFFSINPISLRLCLLVIASIIISTPTINLGANINSHIHLPDFMQPLESWLRQKEAISEAIVKKLLATSSLTGLLSNILIIAIAPAICEELMFRGLILKLLSKYVNRHTTIWITAFIFASIHMQYSTFIPIFLLGGLFGYLVYLTKSLMAPMLAHFTNNALSVVIEYLDYNNIINIADMYQNRIIIMFSAIITTATIWLIYKTSLRQNLKIDH